MPKDKKTCSLPCFLTQYLLVYPTASFTVRATLGRQSGNRWQIVGGSLFKAGCHGLKAFQAVNGAFNLVPFFINFGVVFDWYFPVFLTWNHGPSPCLPNLDKHVVRVVGPVGQDDLPRPQVAAQQPGGLRAIAGLPPVQGQGANSTVSVAVQVELSRKTASAAAERLANGAVFSPAATWCARTAVESTISRCKLVAFCPRASIRGHTPAWRQRRNRAYTGCQGPNRSAGKSHHDTPHRARQRTASTNRRVSRAVVPGECACPCKSGESRSHCATVNILRSLFVRKGRP